MFLPSKFVRLSSIFNKLPGIGPKSAEKIVFYLLSFTEDIDELINALNGVREGIHFCKKCYNFAEDECCNICKDETRDKNTLCVVEEINDLIAIEKAGFYKGLYHVLHGVINPLDGVNPEDIKISELFKRVKEENIKEVIIATNPSFNGDITAMYIAKVLKEYNVKTSRIATGIPKGTDLEFLDNMTLMLAIENRTKLE